MLMVECISDKKSKSLLIIGAGLEQVPAYKLAKKRGLTVIGTDVNPNAPGFEFSDFQLIASTRNLDQTVSVVLEFAQEHTIDGVMTIANDVPLIVATLAKKLGLNGLPIESAKLVSNKLLMKNNFAQHGVSCPWFSSVNDLSHLRKLVASNIAPRYVLKPVDGRGARGVLLIDRNVDLDWAFKESAYWGDSGELMLEEYVAGLQLSTESFLIDGKAFTPAIAERNYEFIDRFSPFIIENGGTIPALLDSETINSINNVIEAGAGAIGVRSGIVKGDIVISQNGEPIIIELALRLSGGWFSTHQIPASSGVDLVNAVISYSLGETVSIKELTPKWSRATAIRYWFPSAGLIDKIEGIENLTSLPGLIDYGFFRGEGEVQKEIKMHADRFGYLIVEGNDRETAINRVLEGISRVKIKVS